MEKNQMLKMKKENIMMKKMMSRLTLINLKNDVYNKLKKFIQKN